MSITPRHVDWRHPKPTNEVLKLIHNIILHIDRWEDVNMIISTSFNGKNGAQLHHVNENGEIVQDPGCPRMFAHGPKSVNKKAHGYLLPLCAVGLRVVTMVDKQVATGQRHFNYKWPSKTLPSRFARQLYTDLALTIGVHPYNLGAIPESTGRFALPDGLSLKVLLCDNLFEFADASGDIKVGTKSKVFHGPSKSDAIPPLIVSLEIVKNATNVRAVVVLEHRNVNYMLSAMAKRGDNRFSGIIYVMTGGFSDQATREFLNLLSKLEALKSIPFLFISDRDPHAIAIFSHLKYGSRASAYLSKISVCSKLEWAGVSIDQYRRLAEDFTDIEIARWIDDHPDATSDMTEQQVERIRSKNDKGMLQYLKGPAARLNASDKARLVYMHKFKVCSEVYDPIVYTELQAMGMSRLENRQPIQRVPAGEKFSVAKLSQYNAFGLEVCILDTLKAYGVPNIVDTHVEAVRISDVHHDWYAAGPDFEVQAVRRRGEGRKGGRGVKSRQTGQAEEIEKVAEVQETRAVEDDELEAAKILAFIKHSTT